MNKHFMNDNRSFSTDPDGVIAIYWFFFNFCNGTTTCYQKLWFETSSIDTISVSKEIFLKWIIDTLKQNKTQQIFSHPYFPRLNQSCRNENQIPLKSRWLLTSHAKLQSRNEIYLFSFRFHLTITYFIDNLIPDIHFPIFWRQKLFRVSQWSFLSLR